MPYELPKDPMEKFLDFLIDQTRSLIEKGYIHAWFTWLEWLFITSLILLAAQRSSSFILWALGIACAVLVFFAGLAGVEKIRDANAVSFWDKGNKLRLVAVLISIIGMWLVMSVVFILLPASLA